MATHLQRSEAFSPLLWHLIAFPSIQPCPALATSALVMSDVGTIEMAERADEHSTTSFNEDYAYLLQHSIVDLHLSHLRLHEMDCALRLTK